MPSAACCGAEGSDPTSLAVVALGASLGDRGAQLALALRLLELSPGLRVLRASRLYRTPPWGGVARNWFLNGAVLLSSALEPVALLRVCQGIERRLGRSPGRRWGDRAVDLDLVWVEGAVVESPELRLPHPGLAARSFVVRPLADVLPDARDPHSGRRILDLHAQLGPAATFPRPVAVGLLRPTARSRGDIWCDPPASEPP